MTAIEHMPPCNPEAEEAVLGSCLLDVETIHTLRGDLDASDFYRSRNAAIYAAMVHLAGQGVPVDFTTLTDELTRRGEYEEVGGYSYFMDLVSVVPTAVHAPHYAAIVARTAVKRRLISAAGKIAAVAYDETLSAEDALARAGKMIADVQVSATANDLYGPEEQADILMRWFAEVADGKPPGILTGFHKLDRETGGLRKTGLYVVGAPTKTGKTAFLGSMILNIAHRERGEVRQLYATCEISPLEALKRFMAAKIGRDMNAVEREWRGVKGDGDIQKVQSGIIEWLYEHGVHIQHRGRLTVDQVGARARRLQAKSGLDVLYVDYLQRLTWAGTKNQGREREVAEMAAGLKTLAGELNVPVVVAVQCNRAAEYRSDHSPQMSDFRESGNIENEADVAIGLYRPAKWPRTQDDPKKPHYGEVLDAEGDVLDATRAFAYILANRHGEADCREELVWMPETTRYGSRHRQAEIPGEAVPWQ